MGLSRVRILVLAGLIGVGLLLGQGGIVPNAHADDGQIYTAYNIWYENPAKVYSTNYKRGEMLPVGSVITNLKRTKKAIQFTAAASGTDFQIVFVSKHHPGMSMADIYDRFTTEKTFEEITAGLSESEIEMIQGGRYDIGMSKEAILVSLGYPPESGTASTELDAWRYWLHRFGTFVLHFDEAGKVESIEGGEPG